MKEYQLIVKTNSYAGNFEREMCAFMTGQIGECGVGSEFVEKEIAEKFGDKISGKTDDHACFRPVEVYWEGEDNNSFVIFLEDKLSKEDIDFLEERAKLFAKKRPYKYLDKGFKFISLEQHEIQTKSK